VGADEDLLDRLRTGDEVAFAELVERYHTRLVRLARSFVANGEVAEEVAQETWLAVVRGIERFEGRSSLRTWLFRICVNRARSIGAREHRIVSAERQEANVDPDRFEPSGAWASPPTDWADAIDDRLEAAVLAEHAHRAIDDLPEQQRQVVTLRDVEGLSSKEVCEVLSISEANQRVLLHRGRSRIRSVLEQQARGGQSCGS
jgi:RNA polymerase sigma-70 factor (ECF subfamily)